MKMYREKAKESDAESLMLVIDPQGPEGWRSKAKAVVTLHVRKWVNETMVDEPRLGVQMDVKAECYGRGVVISEGESIECDGLREAQEKFAAWAETKLTRIDRIMEAALEAAGDG